MSASPDLSSNLAPHHVRNLILILRRANVYYHHVAVCNRANLQPTHHAYKQARRLGLRVDVGKAARCDQRQISLVPLPILDTSTTSMALTPSSSSNTDERLSLGGIEMHAQELTKSEEPSPLKRRPVLKCAIPGVFTRTTPNGTTSAIALSSTSYLSSVTLSSPVIPSTILRRKLVTPARPLSAWTAGDEEHSDIFMEPSVSIPVSPDAQQWQPLDVPIDEEDMNWGLDDITDMDMSPPASFDCGSDSASSSTGTQSSSGPLTPSDEGPIVVRLKRKSIEPCSFVDDFGKRPKFDRKEWAHVAMSRKHVIRIPARNN